MLFRSERDRVNPRNHRRAGAVSAASPVGIVRGQGVDENRVCQIKGVSKLSEYFL